MAGDRVLVRGFLVVAGVVGLAFALLSPPFATPDEATHFFRAYQLAEGRVFAEKQGKRVGGMLPSSVEHDVHQMDTAGPAPGWSARWKALGNPTGGKDRFTDFQNTALYPPLTYAPQVAVIVVGRVAGLSNLAMFYLARLANLAVFLALVWYAARRFPRSAWLPIGVALLPSLLFLAGSVSPDGLTFALVVVLVAELAGRARPLPILAVAGVLGLSKPPYFLMTLLCIAVWLWRGRKGWHLPTAAGLGCALAVAWSRWADHIFVPYLPIIDLRLDVRPGAQRSHLLHHPFSIVSAFVHTAGSSWTTWLGQLLAPWGRGIGTNPVVAVGAGVFLVLVVIATPRRPAPPRLLAVLVGASLATAAATIVAVYLYSNAVGADHVRLVYGRYLLPVLPTLLVAVPPVVKRGRALDAGLLAMAAVIGLAGVVAVL